MPIHKVEFMEIWDVYDENRVLTGKKVVRGIPMAQDEYHLVVHVWIMNSKKELLISKRTPNKTFPNMWECSGGSAVEGDSSMDAALREVEEEIGVVLDPERGRCLYTDKRQHHSFPDFRDVWLFEAEVELSELKFQEDEVSDAKWATMSEVRNMISDGTFISHFEYLDQLFEFIEQC